jgi:hypothetical protein
MLLDDELMQLEAVAKSEGVPLATAAHGLLLAGLETRRAR